MADLYRPSTGTEGADFICAWCQRCARDADEDCDILARTFALEVDAPGYPSEWVIDADGPRCTAFVPDHEAVPYRCPDTLDMFS